MRELYLYMLDYSLFLKFFEILHVCFFIIDFIYNTKGGVAELLGQ